MLLPCLSNLPFIIIQQKSFLFLCIYFQASRLSSTFSNLDLPIEQFSPLLSIELMSLLPGQPLTRLARRELMQHLYFRLTRHTMYPTREDVDSAAVSLVERYPNLRDQSHTGIESWKKCIRDKLNNARRTCTTPEVMAMRKKIF